MAVTAASPKIVRGLIKISSRDVCRGRSTMNDTAKSWHRRSLRADLFVLALTQSERPLTSNIVCAASRIGKPTVSVQLRARFSGEGSL
jgi:hypothetical protein